MAALLPFSIRLEFGISEDMWWTAGSLRAMPLFFFFIADAYHHLGRLSAIAVKWITQIQHAMLQSWLV
jgi:hypothetical protein